MIESWCRFCQILIVCPGSPCSQNHNLSLYYIPCAARTLPLFFPHAYFKSPGQSREIVAELTDAILPLSHISFNKATRGNPRHQATRWRSIHRLPLLPFHRNRLPSLFEVLSRRTLPPVDLFSFYIYERSAALRRLPRLLVSSFGFACGPGFC